MKQWQVPIWGQRPESTWIAHLFEPSDRKDQIVPIACRRMTANPGFALPESANTRRCVLCARKAK